MLQHLASVELPPSRLISSQSVPEHASRAAASTGQGRRHRRFLGPESPGLRRQLTCWRAPRGGEGGDRTRDLTVSLDKVHRVDHPATLVSCRMVRASASIRPRRPGLLSRSEAPRSAHRPRSLIIGQSPLRRSVRSESARCADGGWGGGGACAPVGRVRLG